MNKNFAVVLFNTYDKKTEYLSEPYTYLEALTYMQDRANEKYRYFRDDENVSLLFKGDKAVLKTNKYEWVWEIVELNHFEGPNGFLIPIKGGKLDVRVSTDDNYPGVDVEFLSHDDTGSNPSRPRVVVECPKDGNLRVLIWNDSENEDYTHCIELGGNE